MTGVRSLAVDSPDYAYAPAGLRIRATCWGSIRVTTCRCDDAFARRISICNFSRFLSIFERIYGVIFGSQIAGLRALVAGGGTVPLVDAVKYFDDWKSKTPGLAPVEFDQWIGFLKSFDLMRVENDKVSITDVGREFLLYLSSSNLNGMKAL